MVRKTNRSGPANLPKSVRLKALPLTSHFAYLGSDANKKPLHMVLVQGLFVLPPLFHRRGSLCALSDMTTSFSPCRDQDLFMSLSQANPNSFSVTHRTVLAIAVPMTLGLLTVPLVGMVDIAVIGQLGNAALLGGVAVATILYSLVASSLQFLRMGTTGLTAQALGSGDPAAQRAVLYRALILSVFLGFIIILASPFFTPLSLYLMGGSEAVTAAASDYLSTRLIAMPFVLINFSLFGWLFGMGKSRTGMGLLLFLNINNILLTILFVLGLEMGVAGAALGTLTAEALASFAGLGIAVCILRKDWHISRARLLNRDAFARFMALNSDIFLRSLVLLIAFALFTSLSARQGDAILAANELLMQFFLFGSFFIDGIATAAEQIGGRAIGARDKHAFDRTVRLTAIWGIGLGLCLSLSMWLSGPWVIAFLTNAQDVRQVANDHLIWTVLTPTIAALAFQLDGIFIGATWSAAMRNVSIIATAAFAFLAFVLLNLLGNLGLWLAMLIFLATRGLSLLAMLPGHVAQEFQD